MAWRKNSDASHKKLRATKFKLDASEFKFHGPEFKLGLTSYFRHRISEKLAATKNRPTRKSSGIGRVVF